MVCAWCGRVMEEGEGEVTHTICPSCAARVACEAGFDDLAAEYEALQEEAEAPRDA